jgi:hypothetical protein
MHNFTSVSRAQLTSLTAQATPASNLTPLLCAAQLPHTCINTDDQERTYAAAGDCDHQQQHKYIVQKASAILETRMVSNFQLQQC